MTAPEEAHMMHLYQLSIPGIGELGCLIAKTRPNSTNGVHGDLKLVIAHMRRLPVTALTADSATDTVATELFAFSILKLYK